jgi:hypothetical protein
LHGGLVLPSFARFHPGPTDRAADIRPLIRTIRENLDVVDINGKTVEAIRYRLLAKSGAITLWYSNDESRRWLALEAPAKGGRTLRYIPVRIPTADDLLA